MGAQQERWWYLLLVLVVGTYVALRALLVPWVHDECASLFWFVERGEFLPFRAHWDANNHVLSSAIGTASYRLFGLSLFGSRIGSVLAFALYAWAVHRVGARVGQRVVRWCLWAALLACPFVLDFFSLFRGYGIELAFWMVAVDGLLRLRDRWNTRDLWYTLLALFLANASVLALLPTWAMVVAAFGGLLLLRWKKLDSLTRTRQVVAWSVAGVVPLLAGVVFALELRSKGLLYHGGLEGLIPVTVEPLMQYMFALEGPLVHWGVVLLLLLAMLPLAGAEARRSPLAVIAALLVLDALARVAMAWTLGVNYPRDRAAIHMIPLAILLVAFALDVLASHRPALRWAALLLLAFPMRTALMANVDRTLIWPEQSVPVHLTRQLAELDTAGTRILGAYHQFKLVVPYNARLHGLPVPWVDWEGFPDGDYELVLSDDRSPGSFRGEMLLVDSAPANGLELLQRRDGHRSVSTGRTTLQATDIGQEFIELWREDSIWNAPRQILELRGTLDSKKGYADVELVITAQDAEGRSLFYQNQPLALLRPIWQGEEFVLRVQLPQLPDATRRVVYFWNVHKQPLAFGPITVEARTILTP